MTLKIKRNIAQPTYPIYISIFYQNSHAALFIIYGFYRVPLPFIYP